ncbi:response regulator [bacterium]|nr:response regulator [bacterium]MCP5462550.1 response regulator [bacterium]
MGDKTYTTFQISKLCDVYPTTVINWIEEGKLTAYKTPGGHRRVKKEDLITFLKKFNIPVIIDSDASNSRKILVVDDDAVILETLKALLEKSNFEVTTVTNGFDAGFVIARWMPDLIVLDMVMPDLDGFEICRRLKSDKTTADIPIIAITAYSGTEEISKIHSVKADDYLTKPFKGPELVKKIEFFLAI